MNRIPGSSGQPTVAPAHVVPLQEPLRPSSLQASSIPVTESQTQNNLRLFLKILNELRDH